jgi:magnesium-protoporphyrin IX monomethyl ester (oxidative) cyclase
MSTFVVLVVAPPLSVVRPALGVSALKAALDIASVSSTVEYLSLRFAELAGVELNEFIAETTPSFMLGEWIFAELASGAGIRAREADYLREVAAGIPTERYRQVLALRDGASRFVEDSARRILAHKPTIVGFSTSFEQNCASLAIAARVRALDPDVVICFGGANCEGPMGRGLLENFPQIDIVFSGEADRSFPTFVRHMLEGGDRGARRVITSAYIENMDELPIPDLADFFGTLGEMTFADRVHPTLLFETSRGCWWGAKKHCRFCGLNGAFMAYRAKSAVRVLTEIAELHRRWSVSRFQAVDNIMDIRHIEGVFDILANASAPYRFFYEIKSNLNRDQLLRIARGGVTWIQPGIESLHDRVLELMEKGVTALQNVRTLCAASEIGLRVQWNILCGFPGEEIEYYDAMARMIPLMEHLEAPSGVHKIRLDRFSPYFERSDQLGFTDVKPHPFYSAIYDLPPEKVRDLAYMFSGRRVEAPSVSYLDALTDAVETWRTRKLESDDPPALVLMTVAGVTAVKDTRSCAVQKWRILDDDELSVLAGFRDPERPRLVLPRLAGSLSEDSMEIYQRLVEWKYILVDGDRALSLIIDVDGIVHTADVLQDNPWGWLAANAETNETSILVGA